VVANTRNAHRLIHFAQTFGKGDAMKERLLAAYFSEGKNVDDVPTLMGLGSEIGLDEQEIKVILDNGTFEEAVAQDIYESRQLGVTGVPFFVLDRKFGISGAQSDEVFTQNLEKAWAEYRKENPKLEIISGKDGSACDIDGDC